MSDNIIGTLGEKSIHSALKKYICNDTSKHEVSVGKFIADIVDEDQITEIQSKDFSKLREKLNFYRSKGLKVRIVYPVSLIKYINWVDINTHEVVERRKSPNRVSIYDIFQELYKIREYIKDENLTFTIIALEVEEYKYLDGYGPNNKNRATKIDKVPTKIIEEINFSLVDGYERFIPKSLGQNFTSKDMQKETKAGIKSIRLALLILTELGVIKRTGKSGRMYTYELVE